VHNAHASGDDLILYADVIEISFSQLILRIFPGLSVQGHKAVSLGIQPTIRTRSIQPPSLITA
jgi:hypothetical protein